MAFKTCRIQSSRRRPPGLASGIKSLIKSHSSSVRSLGYNFSFMYPSYLANENFSDRLLGRPKRVSKAGLRGCKHELRPLSSTSHEKKNGSLTAEVILPDDAMQTRTVCLWLVMQAVISFRTVPGVLGVVDGGGWGWPSWVL